MARRATAIANERRSDEELLLFSAGDFYGRPGILNMYRSRFIAERMRLWGYDAVAVGERELAHELRALKADADEGLPVICANLTAAGEAVFPPWVVKKSHGLTVGVFALLDVDPPSGSLVEIGDPVEAGRKAIRALRDERDCDVVILLAHMERSRLVDLMPSLDGIDLVIRGHVSRDGQPADDCADTTGGSFEEIGVPVLSAGDRGRALGRVSFRPDAGSVSAALVHLDASVPDDEETAAALRAFYALEARRRREHRLEDLLARDDVTGKIRERYIGYETCVRCHADLLAPFIGGPHFRAFHTLELQGVEGQPKCLACHTTGYGRFSGYDPAAEANRDYTLRGVQCEACHGAGTRHTRDGAYVEAARTSCRACHTDAYSPDFDFETYWSRGGHGPSRPDTLRAEARP